MLEHPLTGAQVPRPVFEEAAYSYRPESPYRQLWREAETVVGMVAFLADGFSLIDPTMTADSISLAAHGWLGHTEAASAAAVSLALPALAGVWARPGARAVADWVSGGPDLAGAAVRPTGPLARQFDALGVPAARGFVPYDVVVASGESFRAPTRGADLPILNSSFMPNQPVLNKVTAYDFYTGQGGFTPSRALEHMEGIDFTRPVTPVTIPYGSTAQQFVGPRGPGNYFAP